MAVFVSIHAMWKRKRSQRERVPTIDSAIEDSLSLWLCYCYYYLYCCCCSCRCCGRHSYGPHDDDDDDDDDGGGGGGRRRRDAVHPRSATFVESGPERRTPPLRSVLPRCLWS